MPVNLATTLASVRPMENKVKKFWNVSVLTMRQQYQGRAASRYDRRWRVFTGAMLAPAAERAHPLLCAGGRVLDAGCGTGVLLALLSTATRECALWGADASPDMLAQAARRLGDCAHLALWNLDSAPPAAISDAGPFDLVTCTNVAHYLASPQCAMNRLADLVAPGGTLIACDFVRHGWWWPAFEPLVRLADRDHRRTLARSDLARLVIGAGLAVVATRDIAAGGPWRGELVVGRKSSTGACGYPSVE